MIYKSDDLIMKTNIEIENGIIVMPKNSNSALNILAIKKIEHHEETSFVFYENETEICYITPTTKREGKLELKLHTNVLFRNKGYMKKSMKILLEFLKSMNVHMKLYALITSTSYISKHILEKLGFRDDGLFDASSCWLSLQL